MDRAGGENPWQERYLASIADEQRTLDKRDESFYAKSIRADAYMRGAGLLVCLLVGGIVLVSTGNPWGIFVGAVLIVAVLLGVIGLAFGRRT